MEIYAFKIPRLKNNSPGITEFEIKWKKGGQRGGGGGGKGE